MPPATWFGRLPFGSRNVDVVRRLTYLTIAVFVLSVYILGKEAFQSEGIAAPDVSSQIDDAPPIVSSTPPVRVEDVSMPILPMPPPPEPVVFSLIMWSKPSAIEGALLIKSIIMYNSRPTDIHVICDNEAEEVLRSRLAHIKQPTHPIRVWYHKPTWQSMLDRVEREGSIATDHSAGLPGLMKLFIHEILPTNVTKAIFVDTDAFFISDPLLLWKVFDTRQPRTSIIMSSHPDQSAAEWTHASRICSCVMLLDLEKLRAIRFMDSNVYSKIDPSDSSEALATVAFKAKYGEPAGERGRYNNVKLGDQGYWWAIVDYHKDIFEPLSFDFEVTSCLMDMYLTGLGADDISEEEERSRQIHVGNTPQEGKTVLPKLLHFNCLQGHEIYMYWPGWDDPKDSLNIRWGPALRYHNGYKWIWLNQGNRERPEHNLEIFVNDKVVFADEEALQRHLHATKS